ncbi:S-adenosyl-L-methionine-dependent methyltransferase [Xylogone sp. PMI_703]|nr:S-adenosyl-L-methionine-dependent methyltransferase [Xylogone sp. PMI_703]
MEHLARRIVSPGPMRTQLIRDLRIFEVRRGRLLVIPVPKPRAFRTVSSNLAAKKGQSTPRNKKAPVSQHLPYQTPTRKTPLPDPATLTNPKPASNPLKNRIIPIVFGGITLFALSAYSAYLIVAYYKTRSPSRPSSPPSSTTPPPISPQSQADVSKVYNEIAPTFDASVELTEKLMGITRLRKKLAAEARGDVLEVSIGTGRNLDFYDWKKAGRGSPASHKSIRSFTGLDKSPQMLDIAKRKFTVSSTAKTVEIPIRWIVQDATSEALPPSPSPSGKYDTILSTMSLCSVSSPVAMLRNLSAALAPSGRILLLEHGRGKWDWLNKILDDGAMGHAEKFGCWWNRDLGTVIEEAVKESGLEVVEVRRKHGGTTWWVELRRTSSTSPTPLITP